VPQSIPAAGTFLPKDVQLDRGFGLSSFRLSTIALPIFLLQAELLCGFRLSGIAIPIFLLRAEHLCPIGQPLLQEMFQDGATFGSTITVWKSRAMNSGGCELAYRPHISEA
jgi:hypothetical protein